MISIKFTMDEDRRMASMHMDGHADYGDVGTNIYCSAASILAYTLAQNVKMEEEMGILKYKPTIRLNKGKAIITARAKDDGTYSELCHAFLVIQTGFQLLAHNYPEHFVLCMFGEALEP